MPKFASEYFAACTDEHCFWYIELRLPEDMDDALEMDLKAKFKKRMYEHGQMTGHEVVAEYQSKKEMTLG